MVRKASIVFLIVSILAATHAAAGPWASLPEAVGRLRADPADPEANRILAEAEASIGVEAAAGRLAATAALMEAYESFVMRLADGDRRLTDTRRDVARTLVNFGRRTRAGSLQVAGSAWALAASLDPGGEAVGLLRGILLPPNGASHGDIWEAPLDGSELVYFEPMTVRVGCADQDRRCRKNEVYFRFVQVPGLWIERLEVSNDRYRLCVDADFCSPPVEDGGFGDPLRADEPVVGVTWQQAVTFAQWAGRRLPSEAEWERVARGGNVRWRYPWGTARRPELARVLTDGALRPTEPAPVGSFPASPDGIHDLAGNVWEWCYDRYQEGLKELPADGSPLRQGIGRVVRGGSWRRTVDMARISVRSWFDDGYFADDVGFRCVASPQTSVSDARVVASANRAFSIRRDPGRELYGARLSTEDRRYLERRTITWLVLEERVGEAVLQAEVLLRRDPEDPDALELLDLAEAELTENAMAGNLEAVEQLHFSYSRAVGSDPRFDRRFEAANSRLLSALLTCGETFARDGDRDRARRCFEAGLQRAANNPDFRRGLASLQPRVGELRSWRGDGREMVWVPPGVYNRGASPGDRAAATDELPPRQVSVRGFWMDRDEVTNAAYRRCVDAGGCTPPINRTAYDDREKAEHPVLGVSWLQARSYASWAGKRLPTEAEWEWAARAGATTRFPWGDNWDPARANSVGTGSGDRFASEAPVGSFPINVWGLRDLLGNAAEYVQDVYHASYDGAPVDGRSWEQETGPITERLRVVRGGSYLDPSSRLRVSHRTSRRETNPQRTIGFRCAAD
ncbi:MAG: SUMF1/EgtB/PvdO family nonheme iron enzyme [Holophagae bacterium]|jgi:formylglycine-generating enzyme required for sulfatase activity